MVYLRRNGASDFEVAVRVLSFYYNFNLPPHPSDVIRSVHINVSFTRSVHKSPTCIEDGGRLHLQVCKFSRYTSPLCIDDLLY